MQYMPGVKRFNVLSRNDVDAFVPMGIQGPELGKLINLPCVKTGKIGLNPIHFVVFGKNTINLQQKSKVYFSDFESVQNST
jgi:hypothetical protein